MWPDRHDLDEREKNPNTRVRMTLVLCLVALVNDGGELY